MAFILNFPNTPTWNGNFSGSGKFYGMLQRVAKQQEEELDGKTFSYRWEDGWSARIECRKVSAQEAAQIRRNSQGFWGYGWMVESIIKNGAIVIPQPDARCVAEI